MSSILFGPYYMKQMVIIIWIWAFLQAQRFFVAAQKSALNSFSNFLRMAGHPDKKNDYFIVVKVSLSVQIQNFFERQNYVKLILRMCWPPIRNYVFVDFLIRNICYQASFQISTNFLKIRATHLKKFLRICCCTSPEKTQLKKRLFLVFIVFIRSCGIKLLLDLFFMW